MISEMMKDHQIERQNEKSEQPALTLVLSEISFLETV